MNTQDERLERHTTALLCLVTSWIWGYILLVLIEVMHRLISRPAPHSDLDAGARSAGHGDSCDPGSQ